MPDEAKDRLGPETTKIVPKENLLAALALSEDEKSALFFDERGTARLERDEGHPDSHVYIIQITQGGLGLRLNAKADGSGLEAWRQELVELENGTIQRTDYLEPHLTSRSQEKDQHIKAVQRETEKSMKRAFSDEFKNFGEHHDLYYDELVEKVRTGEHRERWDKHGYNTQRITMVTTEKPGETSERGLTIETGVATKRTDMAITYEHHVHQAKFMGNDVVEDSRKHSVEESVLRR